MQRRSPNLLKSVLIITLLTLVLIAVILALLDRQCLEYYERSLIYPDAQLVNEEMNLLLQLGNGQILAEYTTPDSPETVEAWYTRTRAVALQEALRQNPNTPTLPPANWYIEADSATGGSRIIISANCL